MILDGLGARILSQKEAGIQADVVEDGRTFEENALIKAREIAKEAAKNPEYQDAVVLADDSGLEIDYLNKNREFTRPDIWEKILPMISRITLCWKE